MRKGEQKLIGEERQRKRETEREQGEQSTLCTVPCDPGLLVDVCWGCSWAYVGGDVELIWPGKKSVLVLSAE